MKKDFSVRTREERGERRRQRYVRESGFDSILSSNSSLCSAQKIHSRKGLMDEDVSKGCQAKCPVPDNVYRHQLVCPEVFTFRSWWYSFWCFLPKIFFWGFYLSLMVVLILSSIHFFSPCPYYSFMHFLRHFYEENISHSIYILSYLCNWKLIFIWFCWN